MKPVEIYRALDGVTGSTVRPDHRSQRTCSTSVARVIAEEHLGLPGVSVDVTSRRRYLYGPLVSPHPGLDRPDLRGRAIGCCGRRLPAPTTPSARPGVELTFERELRGTYGVQRGPAGREPAAWSACCAPSRSRSAGGSLELTIDLKIQREAEKALTVGDAAGRAQAGRVHRHEPPERRDPGDGLAARVRQQRVRATASRAARLSAARSGPRTGRSSTSPSASSCRPAPPTSWSPASAPSRTARSRPGPGCVTRRFITVAGTKMLDWNMTGWGPINIYGGFAHSSDTFFYQVALKLGIDRLAYWAHELGFGRKTGIDLPGETVGTVPTNEWKQPGVLPEHLPRRDRPGGHRPGLRHGHAASSSSPRTARSPMAARCTGPRSCASCVDSTGKVVRSIKPEVIRKLPIDAARPARRCASRPATCSSSATPTTSWTCRWSSRASPAPPSTACGTARAACRSTPGSWASRPRTPARQAGDPNGFKAVARHRLGAGVPRLRVRLADAGQRRARRSRSTSCSFTTGSRRTTVTRS